MGRPQPAPSAPPDRAVAPLIALVKLSRQVLRQVSPRIKENAVVGANFYLKRAKEMGVFANEG